MSGGLAGAVGILSSNNGNHVVICGSDGNPFTNTEGGYTPVSTQNMVVFDQVDGDAVNTNVWTYSTSGMTIAQTNGAITLNSGSAVTANSYAILKTVKYVPFYGEFPVTVDLGAKISSLPLANVTIEWGIGNPNGTSAITDGVFYRYDPSDLTLRLVAVFNGVETQSIPIMVDGTLPTAANFHDWDLTIDNDNVLGTIDGEALDADDNLNTPASEPYPFNTTRLPVFLRIYNGASSPAQGIQISLGRMAVTQLVVNQNRPWDHTLTLMGRSGYQSPVSTFGQTSQWSNSSAPSLAALSNTVPSYTTLGGIFRYSAVAGSDTDYALFAYQVPVGYQLVIGAVSVSTVITGADVGNSGICMIWGLGLNSSGASLATSNNPPTSWAPRRVALGCQGFIKTQGVGDQGPQIERIFNPPLVVDGGRYLHIILRIPMADATASQVHYGTVTIDGYFD